MLGIYLQRSTILLMATGIPLALIYAFSKPILILIGESPAIASAAAVFVYGLIPQIFAYAANFPIQKFLQSQNIVSPSAYISVAALAVHLLFTWLAVFKWNWGLFGASLVLSLSWWLIVLAQFVYIVTSSRCKQTWVASICGIRKCGMLLFDRASNRCDSWLQVQPWCQGNMVRNDRRDVLANSHFDVDYLSGRLGKRGGESKTAAEFIGRR